MLLVHACCCWSTLHPESHHVDELGLVGWRHDDHVGQRGHVGDVEGAAVRRAVSAHQATAVHCKADCRPAHGSFGAALVAGAASTRRCPILLGSMSCPHVYLSTEFCLGAAEKGERTRQVLQGDVVHDLVEATLQEGGVDGAERHQALARQPRSKCHLCTSSI